MVDPDSEKATPEGLETRYVLALGLLLLLPLILWAYYEFPRASKAPAPRAPVFATGAPDRTADSVASSTDAVTPLPRQ